MKLSLVSIEKNGIVRVAAEGNITTQDFQSADNKNPLEKLLGVTWFTNKVMLNLDRTDYIDSSAIGWLIGSHRAFKEGGGMMVVHSIQPSVRQILDLLKIGKVVPLVPDENEARRMVSGESTSPATNSAGGGAR
jgi:anti-anti-sigma factor